MSLFLVCTLFNFRVFRNNFINWIFIFVSWNVMYGWSYNFCRQYILILSQNDVNSARRRPSGSHEFTNLPQIWFLYKPNWFSILWSIHKRLTRKLSSIICPIRTTPSPKPFTRLPRCSMPSRSRACWAINWSRARLTVKRLSFRIRTKPSERNTRSAILSCTRCTPSMCWSVPVRESVVKRTRRCRSTRRRRRTISWSWRHRGRCWERYVDIILFDFFLNTYFYNDVKLRARGVDKYWIRWPLQGPGIIQIVVITAICDFFFGEQKTLSKKVVQWLQDYEIWVFFCF